MVQFVVFVLIYNLQKLNTHGCHDGAANDVT